MMQEKDTKSIQTGKELKLPEDMILYVKNLKEDLLALTDKHSHRMQLIYKNNLFFEAGSLCVVQTGLELLICLPRPPEC